jgi:ribonucleoside-diphosphate reductase alpha chain
MLIKMNIKYGSKESIALCDKIGFAMADQAINTSADIARDDGVYPKYNSMAVETSPYLRANVADCTYRKVKLYGLNNSQLLTIAPTGSLSSMLGVSGGIEPIFANYYTRKTESLHGHEEYYKVYTPIVEQYMKEHNITDDTMLPDFFVTAQDLDYKNRIEMQAVWQKHIDASISSTVNVPNNFTVEETEDLYMSAWKSGLKGVTIFRDGCKRTGILTTNDTKTDEAEEERKLKRGEIIATDDNIIGLKRKLMTGCGSLHCQAFFDPSNGEFREIYLSKGSSGGCNNYMIGLSRMMSLSARAGVPLDDIVDQLMSTGACPSYAKRGKSKGSCCPMAVGYALKDMHKEFNEHFMNNTIVTEESKNAEKVETNTEKKSKILCPNCGEELVFEGGCNSCKACGWSKCDL